VEITMLWAWLLDTIKDEQRDNRIMQGIFRDLIRAVALKYRLGPKSTEQLLASVTKAMAYMRRQLEPVSEEEL
jgi:hypothetical protein